MKGKKIIKEFLVAKRRRNKEKTNFRSKLMKRKKGKNKKYQDKGTR